MGQSAFFCFSFSHLQDSTNNDKTIKLNIQTSFSELVLSTYREIKRRLAAFKTCPFVNAIMWKVLESKSTETCVLTRTNDWKFDWNKRINTFLLLFGPCKQLWCCDHNNSCKFNQSLWILCRFHNMHHNSLEKLLWNQAFEAATISQTAHELLERLIIIYFRNLNVQKIK